MLVVFFSCTAQDLPPPETIGAFSDPYVRIALVPGVDERVRQSSVKRRTTNPYYNEYFKFPVAFEQLREKLLVFHLYDYDKFSRHSAIGEVEIDLSKVDVSNSVEMWCDIQRHRKVRSSQTETYRDQKGRIRSNRDIQRNRKVRSSQTEAYTDRKGPV